MLLIAESGSTKTDWVIVKKNGDTSSFSTTGFNPNYFPQSVLENSISEVTLLIEPNEVSKIFFYGSGCSTPHAQSIVRTAFEVFFPGTPVDVYHDLFGAARALFGREGGIASILGTGSSSCLFSHGEIVDAVPSLGYLLADEGSGMQLGRMLLNAYFKHDLPEALHHQFTEEYSLNSGDFLNDIYTRQKPNSRISSFVPFIVHHRDHPFFVEMVTKAFRDFFEDNVLRYPSYQKYPLGFTGSIAYLFRDVLQSVADHYGLHIRKVIKNPIDELVKFHIQEIANVL